MQVEDIVFTLLSATLPVWGSPPVTLVPSDRIKPPGNWELLPRPYIIHGAIDVNPLQMHDGLANILEGTYQVSCFADNYIAAMDLSDAVVETLQGTHLDTTFSWNGRQRADSGVPGVEHVAVRFQVFSYQ